MLAGDLIFCVCDIHAIHRNLQRGCYSSCCGRSHGLRSNLPDQEE